MQAAGFYFTFAFLWLITLIPLRILYSLSDLVFVILYYVIPYRKKLAIKNICNSFPEKSKKEIRWIARKFFRHFCDNFLESFALIHMSKHEIQRRFTILNPEVLGDYHKKNKHLIAVSGHHCTWDWFAGFPFYSQYRLMALYKPLHNKYYDALFKKLRGKFGSHTIANTHAVKTMLAYDGPPTVFWFIADQRPLRKDIKYWTKFMNQDAPVFMGVEKIAVKTNFPVIYFHMRKIKRGHYSAEIKILCDNPKSTKENEITEMHVKILEDNIKEQPECYLWSHNRWKHKKFD
ncbi:MAG: lysophospholipid acyltransferase family protein [Bacteroidales bacterium]|nr:lysophospholipid acyltransferase family protein [Bacteroidales bacterium]